MIFFFNFCDDGLATALHYFNHMAALHKILPYHVKQLHGIWQNSRM